MRALVVGYGNPLREDDGVGWHVADLVEPRLPEGASVLRAHQLTPELAFELADAELAVFVDARADRLAEGVIVEAVQAGATSGSGIGSHYVAPSALLATCQALFGRAPRTWLVSVPGRAFGLSEQLTPAALADAERAAEIVLGLVIG